MGHFVGLGRVYANPRTPAQQRASNAGAARQDATFAGYFHGGVVRLAKITTLVSAASTSGANIVPGVGVATIFEVTQADANATPVLVPTTSVTVYSPYTAGTFSVNWLVPVVNTGRFFFICTDPSNHG